MADNRTKRNRDGMPEVVKYIISALILSLAAAATYGLTLLKEPTRKKTSDALVPLVKTIDVQSYSGNLDMVVSGTVVAFREIKVAAEVGGKIIKKYPELQAGNYVKRGTKLLDIDTEEYQLDINTSEREYEQTQRSMGEVEEDIRGAMDSLKMANSDLKLQQGEYNRIIRLSSVLSAAEVDTAKRALLNSQTQVANRENALKKLQASKERMKSTLEVAQSRLSKANLNLARTSVVAPDDGIIVADSVEQGDNVFRNGQLFTIEDTSRSEVRCNLTPGELSWLRNNSISDGNLQPQDLYRLPKTEVEIFEKSDPAFVWKGVLERFDGIGRDELTKSIPVRIVVSNPVASHNGKSKALVRGMYVKCRVVVPLKKSDESSTYACFPEVAVRPGNYVWVVRDKKLRRFDISIVDRTQQDVEGKMQDIAVVSLPPDSISIGDAIVVSPIPQPTEGSPVLLTEDESDDQGGGTLETPDLPANKTSTADAESADVTTEDQS